MSREVLTKESFEDIFQGFEPLEQAGHLSTTVIAEHEEMMLARMRRLSSVILNEESGVIRYQVDLALPYCNHPDIAVVYSSEWYITPLEAASSTPSPQYRPVDKFATFSFSARQSFQLPEDIFTAYDRLEKKDMAAAPPNGPDIRTPEGFREFAAGIRRVRLPAEAAGSLRSVK